MNIKRVTLIARNIKIGDAMMTDEGVVVEVSTEDGITTIKSKLGSIDITEFYDDRRILEVAREVPVARYIPARDIRVGDILDSNQAKVMKIVDRGDGWLDLHCVDTFDLPYVVQVHSKESEEICRMGETAQIEASAQIAV